MIDPRPATSWTPCRTCHAPSWGCHCNSLQLTPRERRARRSRPLELVVREVTSCSGLSGRTDPFRPCLASSHTLCSSTSRVAVEIWSRRPHGASSFTARAFMLALASRGVNLYSGRNGLGSSRASPNKQGATGSGLGSAGSAMTPRERRARRSRLLESVMKGVTSSALLS